MEKSFGTGAGGMKDDKGKLAWNLIILRFIEPIVKVLTYGAIKYAPQSWQNIPSAKERYWNALHRHLVAMVNDDGSINLDSKDDESGLPHLSHAFCNMYFLQYFREKELTSNKE